MSEKKLFIKIMGELFPVTRVQSQETANSICSISNLAVIDEDITNIYLAPTTPLRASEEPDELVFVATLSNGNLYTERQDLTADEIREYTKGSPMVDFEELGVLVFNEFMFSDSANRRDVCKNIMKMMLPNDDRITGDWRNDINSEIQKRF